MKRTPDATCNTSARFLRMQGRTDANVYSLVNFDRLHTGVACGLIGLEDDSWQAQFGWDSLTRSKYGGPVVAPETVEIIPCLTCDAQTPSRPTGG